MTGICIVCKTNRTINSVKIEEDLEIFVCHECLDDADDNILFVCVGCNATYKRDKQHCIDTIGHPGIAAGLEKMRDEKMVFGLSECRQCSRNTKNVKEGHA